MQHISKFEEIRAIVRRSITASFLLTSIINLMFLCASGYTYFIFNSLAKNVSWKAIIVPTVAVVLLFVFGQILQIKRNKIVSNLARFLDSITFNNFIKLGIILNKRQNSVQPSQKLMQDVLMIKNFILQKGLIGIFEIPWCFVAVVIVGYLSRINLVICAACLAALVAILLFQKHSLRDDILDISNNDTKNDDNLSEIFKNYQYISSNIDVENVVAYYAEINEENFTKHEATRRKFEMWQSASKIAISVFQTAIFLCSVFMLIHQHFSFGEFILTTILAGKTLTMMERCAHSISPFKNVKRAFSRIADALQKVATTASNTFISSDKTMISLIDVSHKELQNISCDLEGGNIYVIQGLNETTTADFLKLVGGIITPESGKINCFNNENGYKFLHYCPDKVAFPEARIVDVITGFSEVDKIRIDNILQMLNCKSEIDKLEDGIYTPLHRLENLSLTFMKKINLAAMLYSNANVIILEEPFKYLDKIATENLIISINTMQKIGKLIVMSCSNEDMIGQLNNVSLIKFVD